MHKLSQKHMLLAKHRVNIRKLILDSTENSYVNRSILKYDFSYVSVVLIVNNLDICTFYSNIVTWDMYFLSYEEIKTTTSKNFQFNSKTQRQMFLLRHSRHVCVPPKDTANMASPYKAL